MTGSLIARIASWRAIDLCPIGPRVDHNPCRRPQRLMQPVNKHAFMVALTKIHVETDFCTLGSAVCGNIIQRLGSIDPWFALAEQIEIGPVENGDFARHVPPGGN